MLKLTIYLLKIGISLDLCLRKSAMTIEWCAMTIEWCAIAKVGAQRLSCHAQLQKLVRRGCRVMRNCKSVVRNDHRMERRGYRVVRNCKSWSAMAIVSFAIAKVGPQRLSCRAQLQKLVRNGYRRVFNAYLVI